MTRLADTVSGVRRIDALSYARVVKDGSVELYLEHLDPQKYVFTYTLTVKSPGSFQKGDLVVEKVF